MFKPNTAKLDAARRMTAEIERLQDCIDALLDPICKEALETGTREEIRALIELLPSRLHRSELRTFLNSMVNS